MLGQAVPDQQDRPAELLVGGIQQASEVVLGKAFRLAFAAGMGQDPVEQAGPVTFAVAGEPGDGELAAAAAGDGDDRGVSARGPGAGPGWFQRQSGLVGEDDPRAQPARESFTAGHW